MEIEIIRKNQCSQWQESKPHGFFAGVIDFYFISILIGGVFALFTIIINKPFQSTYAFYFVVILNLFLITLSIFYHKVFAKRVKWLSFGEYLAGKRIIDEKKFWVNNFNCNRWGIFFIYIFTLILLGNEWDKLTLGQTYTILEFLGKMTRVILIFFLVCI